MRREKIIEMIKLAKTGPEIVEEIGVSRQYVHMVAKSEGLKIAKGTMRPSYKTEQRYREYRARINTNAPAFRISPAMCGRISEMMTAADLMARGWDVYMPLNISKGHDIIACMGDRIVTIEVKSGSRNQSGALYYNKHPNDVSAYMAIVVVGEPVVYKPELPV